MAQFLHDEGRGMTMDQAEQLDPRKTKLDPKALGDVWKQVNDAAAQQYGMPLSEKPPSRATMREAIDHLERLWTPAIQGNPEALGIAAQLKQAMSQ